MKRTVKWQFRFATWLGQTWFGYFVKRVIKRFM